MKLSLIIIVGTLAGELLLITSSRKVVRPVGGGHINKLPPARNQRMQSEWHLLIGN